MLKRKGVTAMFMTHRQFGVLQLSMCLGLGVQVSAEAQAGPQVGTITSIQGIVKLFHSPGEEMEGPPPHVLFENEYFSVRDVKVGDRLENKNILRVSPGSSAKVIYDNGDMITVGSSTAYRINWKKDDVKAETTINMMYGKIRGVVAKGGPRSRLKVKTASATMGVRGTEFFVADGGPEKGTEISILRGSVDVKVGNDEAKSKPVEVKAGQYAEIPPPPPPVIAEKPKPVVEKEKVGKTEQASAPAPVKPAVELAPPVLAVRQTSQEELVAIQKSTVAKVEPKKELEKAVEQPPEMKETMKRIEELEKKAIVTVIEDIKKEDPKLYAQISANPAATSSEEIAKAQVTQLIKTAPKEPERKKRFWTDDESIGAKGGDSSDAYEKYFKVVD